MRRYPSPFILEFVPKAGNARLRRDSATCQGVLCRPSGACPRGSRSRSAVKDAETRHPHRPAIVHPALTPVHPGSRRAKWRRDPDIPTHIYHDYTLPFHIISWFSDESNTDMAKDGRPEDQRIPLRDRLQSVFGALRVRLPVPTTDCSLYL